MAKSEPIRNLREIKQIESYFLTKGQIRNYVLFKMGIYTSLRISDLLNLNWSNVYDFNKKTFYTHLCLFEKKTKKNRKIALNEDVIEVLSFYLSRLSECNEETWLFPNNRKNRNPISRIQAYRIICKAVADLDIQGNISCHSMRKVIGYHSWKKGIPLPLISEIYGHTSEKVTKLYLGIKQDEIDRVFLEQNY